MSGTSLSVVLPAWREGGALGASLQRVLAVLDGLARPADVIVVDDGSADDTFKAASAVAAEDPRVRVLRHERNQGKGKALATGCAAATGEVVVLLDADLQIPPESLVPLVARIDADEADLVVGSKYIGRGARAWPRRRRVLSALYRALTAVLFRLPLRDTQTGIKALRAPVARALLPHIRSRRFAWDLEFVFLAHRAGWRCASVPVTVAPASRASRVRPGGALHAAVDTLRIAWRARALAAYPRGRPAERAPARLVLSGDDLGMAPSTDAGLVDAARRGGLTSVGVLASGPTRDAALVDLQTRAPEVATGLHLDLHGPGPLVPWLLRSAWPFSAAARAVGDQIARQLHDVRAAGARVRHLDVHRHAWLWPWVRRDVARAARRDGVVALRALHMAGPLRGAGTGEALKRLLLRGAAMVDPLRAGLRGVAVPHGQITPDEARRWVDTGRVPAWARGRVHEVVAHPARGALDVPEHEVGALDRHADHRRLVDPPLGPALAALGVEILKMPDIPRRHA